MSSNRQLMESSRAFVIKSLTCGKPLRCGRWLGDTSVLVWPSRIFNASDMRGSAYVLRSWGPKRAFNVLDLRDPHSYPYLCFSLTKLVALSG